MESLLQPITGKSFTSVDRKASRAASAPFLPPSPGEGQLKVQISAPSYLHSLKENDAPPFRTPGKEIRPKLLIGTIMDKDEAIDMIAAADTDKHSGLKNYLAQFVVNKKITENYNVSEKSFLVSFLAETVDYGAQRDLSALKLACLVTVYLNTHTYFKWYYWLPTNNVWFYFKELMIRHTIEDSPDGQAVFEPQECYDILSHFHAAYITNLPLVHILTFGVCKVKFLWTIRLN
ncbi:hypothetical protein ACJJTC_016714 [Scirpophaga incertulas]